MQNPWVVGKKFASFPSHFSTQPFQYFQIVNLVDCLSSWYKFLMNYPSDIKFAKFIVLIGSLTCIPVHLNLCMIYVYIFIIHLRASTVNVKLICITVAKQWGGCVEHQIYIFAYGLLGIDQVWWKKWWQDIALNYWGKRGSVMCPTNDSELALHTTSYVIFVLLYSSSLYYLMVQNLKIHAF